MEKKSVNQQETEQVVDIVARAKANKKTIIGVSVAVLLVVVVVFVWILVAQKGARNADNLIAAADAAQSDSIALVLYQKAADAGYKSGNRAKAEAGILLYREGKYEEAVKYLNDASLDDEIANAGVALLEGDCYANIDQLDKALSCFDKAIKRANKNPQVVPFALIKKANIYRVQENYSAEAAAYKTILDEYPVFVNNSQNDIRKYYERALAASQNK